MRFKPNTDLHLKYNVAVLKDTPTLPRNMQDLGSPSCCKSVSALLLLLAANDVGDRLYKGCPE